MEISLAMLIATVAGMVVGAVWYSPLLFAKSWMHLVGKKDTDMNKGGNGKLYLLSFVGTFVMAVILSNFIHLASAKTVVDGMKVGFWGWLGFVAPATMAEYLFEGRPRKLYLLNNGHILVTLMVMGAILAVWG